MGIYAIKPKFQRTLAPIVDYCLRHHISAHHLNICGLVSAYLIALSIVFHTVHPYTLLVIPFLAFIRTACNALDGLVSRAQNQANAYGQFVNETVDRVSDSIIFLSFLFIPGINIQLVAIATSLVLLSSYVAVATQAAGGPRLYNGVVGKADRMLYLSILAVILWISYQIRFVDYFLLFIAITTLISLTQRLVRARQELTKP